jgi:ABC-type bacteriocin/lantibiotic exporter with double-glycine peptidase domain
VLIPLPLISIAGWAYSRRYHARTERLQERWGEAATLVEETVSGIRVVKGLGAGGPLAAEFRRRSRSIVDRALEIAHGLTETRRKATGQATIVPYLGVRRINGQRFGEQIIAFLVMVLHAMGQSKQNENLSA